MYKLQKWIDLYYNITLNTDQINTLINLSKSKIISRLKKVHRYYINRGRKFLPRIKLLTDFLKKKKKHELLQYYKEVKSNISHFCLKS